MSMRTTGKHSFNVLRCLAFSIATRNDLVRLCLVLRCCVRGWTEFRRRRTSCMKKRCRVQALSSHNAFSVRVGAMGEPGFGWVCESKQGAVKPRRVLRFIALWTFHRRPRASPTHHKEAQKTQIGSADF